MTDPVLERLTRCSCCSGTGDTAATTAERNRAGLSLLSYRIGTHGRFKDSMLAALSTMPSLRHLTTRRDDDWTIALLDSWAVALDVLTFYQERIANEGFLRTAVERRSLLELARTIGYELRPGVAAGTHLAFTLDGSPGSPEEIVLRAGTRAQSIPGQDELPEPFETSTDLVARPEWSALKPRLSRPQTYDATTRRFLLRGTGLQLGPGDRALLVISSTVQVPLMVLSAEADPEAGKTLVITESLAGEPLPQEPEGPVIKTSRKSAVELLPARKLDGSVLEKRLGTVVWDSRSWSAYAKSQRWSRRDIATHLKAKRRKKGTGSRKDIGIAALGNVTPGLFALRSRAGIFGHNAPLWGTTPIDWRVTRTGNTAPYPSPGWEARLITQDATGTFFPTGVIYLERSLPEILPESWAVLQDGAGTPQAYQVERADEESVADFGLAGKATRLRLANPDVELPAFSRRGTTVYAQSEELELAELPIETPVEGDVIELEEPDFLLEPGRRITVRGERADLPGVETAEVAEVEEILHVAGVTRLVLTAALEHSYVRTTVTLNANTVAATHGESRSEVLGSGDAASLFQRFTLKQNPLTYTAAPVPSGGVSTLELRVNGVLWHETPSFFDLPADARSYVLRRDDAGRTSVLFGDGERGARLPTGVENVRASYRTGVGLTGQMDRDRITLLATRPLGVREVTNPVPAEDAEDPESRDQARTNAPLTVRTLDRIVSLSDFEDFARAFSGIGKASADRLWDGSRRVAHLTLAAADGGPVSAALAENLQLAMDRVRDPTQPILLGSFEPLFFAVGARLKIDPDYLSEVVLATAQAALQDRFSFTNQDFAQRVAKSEVLAILQRVEGVLAVDLETFELSPNTRLSTSGAALPVHLEALPARRVVDSDGSAEIRAAQLLTLAPGPVALEEMS